MELKISFEALKKMTIQEIIDIEDSIQDLMLEEMYQIEEGNK